MVSADDLHVPVMAEEALCLLRILPEGVYVDATAGAGGHAERIASRLSGGRLIALDRDPAAVAVASRRLSRYACAKVIKANYSTLKTVLTGLGIASVDGILLDAGVSSIQLDTSERGFSLQADGPLDMRMDTTEALDAAAWLARCDVDSLAAVLRNFGDVKPAGRIARVIVARCREGRMQRTSDLAAAVKEALDFVASDPEEIRTVFQSVRIATNSELNHLDQGLRQAMELLNAGGRLVAISFHSGEDRIVKHVFREATRPSMTLYPDGRVKEKTTPKFNLVLPKPLTPTAEEKQANPRASSARMRAIERIGGDRKNTNEGMWT
jgi:16S rRNA (cytosine1402-N4)-methyltransferase